VVAVSRPTYHAVTRRSGDWWAIEVPDLPGVFSQARRLDKVEGMARDAIAGVLDVDPGSFDVTVETDLPDSLAASVRAALDARRDAEAARRDADAKIRRIAALLVKEEHLSLRDAGRLLGISHQRVDQLLGGGRSDAA
jgi:predicted RNase H-like HicB family nuclease